MADETIVAFSGKMISEGTSADDVLEIVGYMPHRIEKIGKDEAGYLIRWHYMRYNLLLRRTDVGGVLAYRVYQIEHKPQRGRNVSG